MPSHGRSRERVFCTRRAYTLQVRRDASDRPGAAFRIVERAARTLPGVERATRYDGAAVLRVGGVFMAGVAMHPSAEAGSLVVKLDPADRPGLLEDAPETYYLTHYYRPHPVVLVRLARIEPDALRDLLAMASRFASQKSVVSARSSDLRPRAGGGRNAVRIAGAALR